MAKAPKKIRKPKTFLLYAEWDDGFSATIKLEKFRQACPCATCNEDEFHPKQAPAMQTMTIGKNDLVKLEPVGNYAIAAAWGDGHNTGIYPWGLFREIFEKNSLTHKEIDELKNKPGFSSLPQFSIRN